ncbi:DNA-binding transcriptional activator FeaR [Kordia sp. SMS9]|uniref:helix-turn-helix transcriptional regulator n=1 Tax=Kordia sp. SMS9 TaxID=2282170 RepID=UPI000E102954|nr:helix-turn-helix transcriptional regulator [Kordia sp. SMS9]AXG69834.1 DNA-binding transcriptional activator FeaR [Kordia sp. SMS9]
MLKNILLKIDLIENVALFLRMETDHFISSIGIIIVLFFATVLLTSKRYKSRANHLLTACLITLSLLMLRINAIFEETLFFEILCFLRIEYLFSVFLYMYVCEVIKEKISKTTFILFLSPFMLLSSLYIGSIAVENSSLETFLEGFEVFETYIIITFNVLVVTLAMIKIYRSNAEFDVRKWLFAISWSLIVVMLFFLILEVIELLFDVELWGSFGVIMSLFFVRISYTGIQKLQIQQDQKAIQKIYSNSKKSTTAVKNNVTLNHFEHMQLLMRDEELFRDPSLNRTLLAEKLGLSVSSVTRILKEEGQISCKDFINQYRIQLAKEMLTDVRFHVFSLEAIGKEVGFKSRSTFYETFKKEVGVSPGTFKKK